MLHESKIFYHTMFFYLKLYIYNTEPTYLFDVRYCFVLYEQFHRYQLPHLTMAEFILETSYYISVRRIIPLSINPKKNFAP